MAESRRAHYRVLYPIVERPTFEVGRQAYEVVECSERGLRYVVPDRHVPEIGTALGGSVRFRRGARIDVTGEVTRADSGLVVLLLDKSGIPFSHILLEQQYLRSKGYALTD